jgi:hypothetical protein
VKDYCRTCKERTGLTARGVCEWCDTPLTVKRGGGRAPGAGCKLTDTQLRALHAAHMRGQSINELAKSIYKQVGYSSQSSCASSISNAWQRLGLQARDRIEMTVLKSYKHGRGGRQQQRDGGPEYAKYRRETRRKSGQVHGRRCDALRTQYPRKGQPCSLSALNDSDFCYQHDPRFEAERNAHLERMRAAA